jgi:hypothetical protein
VTEILLKMALSIEEDNPMYIPTNLVSIGLIVLENNIEMEIKYGRRRQIFYFMPARGKPPSFLALYIFYNLPIFFGKRYTSCLYLLGGALYNSINANA